MAAEAPTEDTVAVLTQWVPAGVPEGTRRSSGDAVKKQQNRHGTNTGCGLAHGGGHLFPKRTHMEGRGKGLKEKREGKKGGRVDSRRIKTDAKAETQRRVFGLCTEWQETSVGIHI